MIAPRCILPLAVGIVLAACAPSLSLTPRLERLDLDGEIGIEEGTTGSAATTSFDTLGMDEGENVLGGRLDLAGAGGHLTLSYQASEHAGRGALAADVSSDGVTIPAGSTVDSDLELGIGEVIVTWDLVPGDTFEAGLGLGASVLSFDARLEEVSTGNVVAESETLPIPVLALRLGVNVGRFDGSLLLGGIGIQVDDDRAAYFDLDAAGRWRFLGGGVSPHGELVVGYRWIELDVDYESDSAAVDAEVTLQGPYVGVSFGI
jgi:hypothetical protein